MFKKIKEIRRHSNSCADVVYRPTPDTYRKYEYINKIIKYTDQNKKYIKMTEMFPMGSY